MKTKINLKKTVETFKQLYPQREQATKKFMKEFNPMCNSINNARASLLINQSLPKLYKMINESEFVKKIPETIDTAIKGSLQLEDELRQQLIEIIKKYFPTQKTISKVSRLTFFKFSDLKSEQPKLYEFYKSVSNIFDFMGLMFS